jgi:membrane fusion protein (multidrug efflux system)
VKADLSVISAKVAGIITAVPIKVNLTVRAGDVLAEIDDRDYKIAVDSARNKLATQEATIERLKQQAITQRAVIEQAKAQLASAKASPPKSNAI